MGVVARSEVQSSVLSNGMLLATDRVRGAQSVSINLWVKTGSRFEDESNNGISHFLEHMAFKSTEKRSTRDIAVLFDRIGGHFNACTGRENTTYYTTVLKDDIEIAMDIISDMLLRSKFLTEEIEKEKGVVIQEIHRTNDDPSDIIFDKYVETAFPNQKLGRSILGTKELVSSFSKKTLQDYVDQFYAGNNMCLAIAGDIDHDDMKVLAEKYMQYFEKRDVPTYEKASYSEKDNICLMKRSELEQVNLVMGFKGLNSQDLKELTTLKLLSTAFGGSMSSRLFQKVREEKGLAYAVSSFLMPYVDTGLFSVYSGTTPELLNVLIDTVCSEINSLCQSGLTEDEMSRSKSQMRSSYLMSEDSMGSRASRLGSSFVNYGRYIPIDESIQMISEVSNEYITDLIRKIVGGSRLTVACIGNVDEMASYDEILGKISLSA